MLSRLFFLTLCVSLLGCAERSAYENVRISLADVDGQQGELGEAWKNKKQDSLTWRKAIVLLEARNLSLKNSRFRLEELRGERKHFVWRQLNPRLIAYANFNAVLGDLSALSSNGFGASLLGSVNVPDPVGFYARRYALELQYYQALVDQAKLDRDLKASLYDMFLEQGELDELSRREVAYDGEDYKKLLSREIGGVQSGIRLLHRSENLRLRVNRLLDSPGANYALKNKTLPSVSYASKISSLNLSKGFGRLAIFQMAGQLEMANARLWQVKYSQLPRVSSGASLPPLYSESGSQDFQFEDVALYTSLSRTIEFTGKRKRDKKRIEQQVEYLRHTMKSRLEQEMVRFDQSKANYRLLLDQMKALDYERKFLRNHPPEMGVKSMLDHVQAIDDVERRLLQNQKRVQRMDLRFWVWDDKYWGLPF